MQLCLVTLSIILLHASHVFSAANPQPTPEQLAQALARRETTPKDVIRNFQTQVVAALLEKLPDTYTEKPLSEFEGFANQIIARACWSTDGKNFAVQRRTENPKKEVSIFAFHDRYNNLFHEKTIEIPATDITALQFISDNQLAIGTGNYDQAEATNLHIYNLDGNGELLTLKGHPDEPIIHTITQHPKDDDRLTVGLCYKKSPAAFITTWHKTKHTGAWGYLNPHNNSFQVDESSFIDAITYNPDNPDIVAATFVLVAARANMSQPWRIKICDVAKKTVLKELPYSTHCVLTCCSFSDNNYLRIISSSDFVGYWNYETGVYKVEKTDNKTTLDRWSTKKNGVTTTITEHGMVVTISDPYAQAAQRFNIPLDQVHSTLTLEQACSLSNQHK